MQSRAKGHVQLDDLAAVLQTEAWDPIQRENTALRQWLLQHIGSEEVEGAVDYNGLVILGLLYCSDDSKPKAKAEELFRLLQDGGPENRPTINCEDEDFKPILRKLIDLAALSAIEGAG